ncbi:MAG: hypothetical protein GY809_12960 [Planctomycetes bacterium]|nr:hypothetical protein [Planctomycetota bacterium]
MKEHFKTLRTSMILGVLCIVCTMSAVSVAQVAAAEVSFDSARPIWPAGRDTEKNLFVGFRAVLDGPEHQGAVLRIAASSLYRIYLNGQFIGHGPARGPHGHYRVDEWSLDLSRKRNILAIEVAGYNVNSYYLLDEPAFLQAEVVFRGKTLVSTAGQGVQFAATILTHRVQKVQRYSFQRPFIEYYRLAEGDDHWWNAPRDESSQVACAAGGRKKLLIRRVGYPRFLKRQPLRVVSRGTLKHVGVWRPWKDRALVNIGPALKGYTESELENAPVPSLEMQTVRSDAVQAVGKPYQPDEPMDLEENTFSIVDLGTNLTGFIGASVHCTEPTKLYFTFDEILAKEDVDFKRLGCVNTVCYELEPGTYDLESFEPYTLRYLKLNVLEGACRVSHLYLREYANSETEGARFSCSDPRLNQIFEAARETFKQNATDIFMDCPSRERAGWLCDSFFTSRVAYALCGNTTIETNLFENYLLPESFAHLPDGMLPMCYPADHYDGVYIPNWALWFVIQLEEYQARSGDRALVAALKPRLAALYEYFQPHINEDGLLEKLDSWIFVEWSAANGFVQDVSYPTNMLYAAALAAAGRLYDEPDLVAQSEQIRRVIREQSFDGEFFVDNAIRKDGVLKVTRNRTEVCQYFAFFFDVATPKTHAALWQKLAHEFGPQRKETQAFPEIHPANAFVGNYLRAELLSQNGHSPQIKKELVDFYLYMAEQTGTLWENVGTSASCNHGFASHVAFSLYRDVLGVHGLDTQRKVVQLRLADVALDWCEGRIMTPQGPVTVKWSKQDHELICRADLPAGYVLKVDNLTGLRLNLR